MPTTKYTPEHTRYGMPQTGVALPATRYTTHEWSGSNANQYLTSSTERTSSQNLRNESERLRCEAADKTRRTQNDINVKLQDRIDNIVYWKTEVDRQLQKSDQEIANLMASKKQLEQAHVATQLPHEVATTCLKHREGRLSIDLVHDDVEIQLLKVTFVFFKFQVFFAILFRIKVTLHFECRRRDYLLKLSGNL